MHITLRAAPDQQHLAQRIAHALTKDLLPHLGRPQPQWQRALAQLEAKLCATHQLVFEKDKTTPGELVFSLSEVVAQSGHKRQYFWSEQEHLRYLVLHAAHGRNWKAISEHIQNRSYQQIRTHAQKYTTALLKLAADIEEALGGGEMQEDFYCRLNKYLSERQALLALAQKEEKLVDPRLFPAYMAANADGEEPHVKFETQMEHVLAAIRFETAKL